MTRLFIILFLLGTLAGCKSSSNIEKKKFPSIISVDTILDEKISIRALMIDGHKIWFGADQGRYGYYDLSNQTKKLQNIPAASEFEFRSISETSESIFILNAGSPAMLYKISKNNLDSQLVYTEIHPKAFYDSMQFWNDTEGMAMGDPTEDCFSIITTSDGGNTWNKIPCSSLPKTGDGEAAFASSNTNLILKGNKAWIVSGGKQSRVFYYSDKGKNWQVYETPMIQGSTMTGIFTADFYDENTGIIAGGDYEKPEQNSGNKAMTHDGGKTWKPVSENSGFGYASCIQFAPGNKGKQLACAGASGLYYSIDGGLTWQELLDDKSLYTIRFLDENTIIGAGKNKIIRIKLKK